MIMRRRDHDVRGRHAGFFFDPTPGQHDHVVPRADRIKRHDGRSGLTVCQDQHASSKWISHARNLASMPSDFESIDVVRCDIHLGHTSPQV